MIFIEVNETFFQGKAQIQQIVHVTNPKVSTIKLVELSGL
jgi:hypothetical protein